MGKPMYLTPNSDEHGYTISKENVPIPSSPLPFIWLPTHSYLIAINVPGIAYPFTLTDKAEVSQYYALSGNASFYVRWVSKGNLYEITTNNTSNTTSGIAKVSSGTTTWLANPAAAPPRAAFLLAEASGSSLKYYVFGNPPINLLDPSAISSALASPTQSLSATDTTFTSGLYFARGSNSYGSNVSCFTAVLHDPFSDIKSTKIIIEIPITEQESIDNEKATSPNFPHKYVEVKDLTSEQKKLLTPEQLKEANRYYTLKAKGYTDDEIEALLGYIPFHQVDMMAVEWGVFDHKGENTMVVMVRGGNPLNPNAISDLVSVAKQKGWKIHKIPQNPSLDDIGNLHKAIKQGHPDIIAGKHDLAYQVLGHDFLEPLAVADYYNGFVEGTYDFKDAEKVPDWEMSHIINDVWVPRLKRSRVSNVVKGEHMNRLIRFAKERGVYRG